MQQTFYDLSAFELLAGTRPLLVRDGAYESFGITLPCEAIEFSDFQSNPLYEDAETGAKALLDNKCDFILAVGGGSAIDTAKCIKYLSGARIPIMAIPTTAGTGSEATHFAAIYKDGEKQSISDLRILPDYAVLQPDFLRTLPVYQKKCTMLDALCQAIESWWSLKATAESAGYSQEAIRLILGNMGGYLSNDAESRGNMLAASNFAGKAINITTTTAPHAMSYKLTSLYGLPHGHAVAICLPKVWRFMSGSKDIAQALGRQDSEHAASYLEDLLFELDIRPPRGVRFGDLDILANSVNEERLGNNPVALDRETIRSLYAEILEL